MDLKAAFCCVDRVGSKLGVLVLLQEPQKQLHVVATLEVGTIHINTTNRGQLGWICSFYSKVRFVCFFFLSFPHVQGSWVAHTCNTEADVEEGMG